jgi:asparagine synthase (glutamine-hydrolysing)
MCGIAGIVSLEGKPVRLQEVRQMCSVLRHRGPDDEGFFFQEEEGIAMGMRRLSIIDLKTGRQPIRNEDGSIWIVFNGEIYNFRELYQELTARGHTFLSATDTEVIVHLYEEMGARCVEKLRGMFAFGIWDSRRKEFLLARDRLGIKPLYYGVVDGRLAFASELKAILQLPEVSGQLSWEAVSHLFTFLATPPAESIIHGIQKLEPGHTLTLSAGRPPRVQRYWNLEFNPNYRSTEDQLVDQLRNLLEESVRLHMISDVPLGAFLSGGIDSSAVVALMARMSSRPVRTFSIGFRENDYKELEFASMVADKFGTEHQELTVEPNALQIADALTWHLDEPFGDSSAIPTYIVSRLASQHVKVVLSGDGGDEIFAGYDRYLVEQRERGFRFLPWPARMALATLARALPEGVKGRNFLRHMTFPDTERYLDACTLFRPEGKLKLFQPEVFQKLSHYDPWQAKVESIRTQSHWLSSLQHLDLHNYLPLDILTKVDRTSMAHSLEARVPLLDHKLVEFAATIPPELQLKGRTTKYLFKRAMRGILPDSIIDRPKRGFAIPLGRWFRGQLGNFVRQLLLSERSRQRNIFNAAYIETLLQRHERGEELDLQLWTLISFELWCRTFLDGRSQSASACAPHSLTHLARPKILDGLESLLQRA